MRDIDIKNTLKECSFLEELGFLSSIGSDSVIYERGEDRIEFWFDYYGFEIDCVLFHKEEKLDLIEIVDYFNLDKTEFHSMFHSYEQIAKVLKQIAGYICTLIKEKKVFESENFGNIALWSMIKAQAKGKKK